VLRRDRQGSVVGRGRTNEDGLRGFSALSALRMAKRSDRTALSPGIADTGYKAGVEPSELRARVPAFAYSGDGGRRRQRRANPEKEHVVLGIPVSRHFAMVRGYVAWITFSGELP